MGRSVMTPRDAVELCYRNVSDVEDEWEWEYFKEWIQDVSIENWPSMVKVNARELEREIYILAENDLAYVTVSEYCGLACVALVSKGVELADDWNTNSQLADYWCGQVDKKFHESFGEYRKMGAFSNGESIYEKIEPNEIIV